MLWMLIERMSGTDFYHTQLLSGGQFTGMHFSCKTFCMLVGDKRLHHHHSKLPDVLIKNFIGCLVKLFLAVCKLRLALKRSFCRGNPSCITNINGFAMAYNFSMVTQQTIGKTSSS